MQKDSSRFDNQIFIPKPRPVKSINKVFMTYSLLLGLSFLSFKLYNSSFYKKFEIPDLNISNFNIQIFNTQKLIALKSKKLSSKENEKESHTLPLLISLKGQDGPKLAKVFVSIYLDSESFKKENGKEIENLENQLRFLLSGQSITHLSSQEFQNQIQNQLNLFLSHQMIQDLNIKTELLNETRSSL